MANPDNALGTNGAFGGRTSVNAFNDVLGAFDGRGILSGWGCVPDSGLNIKLGGTSGVRDVAIAEDPAGNKTTVNNISREPVSVAVNAAPASNSRVDSIVAYIESTPRGDAVLDNPDAVNLLVVSGSVASSPEAPTDSQIRTAITGDGASGATAYYVVLANVTIPAGATDIDITMIANGAAATLSASKLADGSIVADKIDFRTLGETNIIRLGEKKIMWGRATLSNVTSGQDKTIKITFPEAFNNTPRVVVACANWIAIRAVFSNGTDKTGTTLGAMHAQGSTQTVTLDWVAIG